MKRRRLHRPASVVALAVAVVVVGSLPAGAQAQGARGRSAGPVTPTPEEPERIEARSEFWRQVAEPRYRRSRTLLRHGLRRLADHQRHPPTLGPAQVRAILEGAIHRLELAHRITPRDPEILYLLASAKALWVRHLPGGGEERLDDEAVELFERLRRIDPSYDADDVAFQLGVLHTRARRFDRAAEEYRRAIDAELMLDTSPVAWSNLAEVTMLSGDLAHAVEHFERAAELYRRVGASNELALWGLAVALDRLGEHRSALDRAREALAQDGFTMNGLRRDGVFFEPPYEIHWYEALGHEALSGVDARPEDSRSHLQSALDAWNAFLRASDGESPWDDVARRNRDRISQELGDEAPEEQRGPRGVPSLEDATPLW